MFVSDLDLDILRDPNKSMEEKRVIYGKMTKYLMFDCQESEYYYYRCPHTGKTIAIERTVINAIAEYDNQQKLKEGKV